jgi:L-methionine (R)-S-oxide reductase
MAESLIFNRESSRDERYRSLTPQVQSLFAGETDFIANAANLSALIHEAFGFHWVGFYMVKGEELVLGPFQGPIACTRIAKGRGVCGTAWARAETVLVPNVEEFPGHIACSALSKSELVIPVKHPLHGVMAVLDIDSAQLDDFNEADVSHLNEWVRLLEEASHG